MGPDRRRAARSHGHRRAAALGACALAGWLLLIAAPGCDAIRDLSRRTIFQPEHAHANEGAASEVQGLERWWLDVPGGRVEAWYLPPLDASRGRAPAVVFAHGNAELIDDWARELEPYRAMGLAVLLPEYRGYARSGGAPSEQAILEDYQRFCDRLTDRPEIDPSRLVLHGRSLGGGVAGVLSAQRLPRALILESTFTNVPDVASGYFAPAALVSDRFDTREVLLRSSTPVLIVHGEADPVVPFKHARELHRVAWDSRMFAVRDAGHDVPHDERYWRRVREFLEETGVVQPPAPITAR